MSRARLASSRFAGRAPLHTHAIEQPLLTLLVLRDAGAASIIWSRNTHSIAVGVGESVARQRVQGRGGTRVREAMRASEPASGTPIAETKNERAAADTVSSLRELPMTLTRSILINALTRLVSRNAEATNINVLVVASFAEPNRIVVAYKQQSAVTQRCCADDR